MKGIIIGDGEVGTSLYNILKEYYPTKIRGEDEPEWTDESCDILHICFPYSDEFKDEVRRYIKKYNPEFTIIHSTVPVGTSREVKAMHSPIRGKHPKLERSIREFVKYIGGEKASYVADYFRRADIRVYLFDKPETTELMKILSTTMLGVNIEFTQEVKKLCDKFDVPFSAWTHFTDTYNKGYKKQDKGHFNRPNLVPIMKELGGHCLSSNAKLLDSKFTKLLQKLNGNI